MDKYATDVTKRVLQLRKSEHVRSMMDSVAAGAEELASSVQEISSSMVKSKDAADKAMQQIGEADRKAALLNLPAGPFRLAHFPAGAPGIFPGFPSRMAPLRPSHHQLRR